MGFPGANAGDAVSVPGLGRYPGEENGNPFQEISGNPCLENPMVSLAGCIVHGLAKESDTT